MFEKKDCTYAVYREILNAVKNTGRYCDYNDVLEDKKDSFLVLRHDIEFSVDRAYRLSRIEEEEGIESSYFVQITNNSYNALSQKNIRMIRKMHEMGHHIGLHYHSTGISDLDELKKDISYQAEILSAVCGVPVDRFSFHRPSREYLASDLKIDGLINVYDFRFFTFTEDLEQELEVKYIADSNHQWRYGVASEQYFKKYEKIQLLIHPLSWSEEGADHVETFQMIVQEKHDEFVDTVENEWKLFDQLRGKL